MSQGDPIGRKSACFLVTALLRPAPGSTRTRTYDLPSLRFQLESREDGQVDRIVRYVQSVTDAGPITEQRMTANADARREMLAGKTGLTTPGPADTMPPPRGMLAAQMANPSGSESIRRRHHAAAPGYIYDMGQNMVGWCRLKVQGQWSARSDALRGILDDGTLPGEHPGRAGDDVYTLRGTA